MKPSIFYGASASALWVCACVLSAHSGTLSDSSRTLKPVPERHSIAVLDPIEAGTMARLPALGEFLRSSLRASGHWKALDKDAQDKRFREYRTDPSKACKEFQCAFDGGSVLQTEYVLFGTSTDLGNLYAYSFTLLHVPSAQAVWSALGEVVKKTGADPAMALDTRLEGRLRDIRPDDLIKQAPAKKGLMAVLDLSRPSPFSRVIAERVSTHVYASRAYDLLNQVEMEELLRALAVDKSRIDTAADSLISLGAKLGVSQLICSRVAQVGREYRFNLALYDITAKRKVRDWPSASEDFRSLFHYEDRFFSALAGDAHVPDSASVLANAAVPSASGQRTPHPALRGKGFTTAIGISAGVVLGYLSYRASLTADREYRRSEAALSLEQAVAYKSRTSERDSRSGLLGALAALSFGVSAVVWVF